MLDIFNVSDCCVTILEFMLFVNVGTPLIGFNSAPHGLSETPSERLSFPDQMREKAEPGMSFPDVLTSGS